MLSIDGPLLVLAGAGAGKTRVIVERILEIIRHGVPPEQVLAITFTNKAASEMRERVLKALPATERTTPFISTFHSLGLYLIKAHAKMLGYKRTPAIYDRADSMREIKRALKSIGSEDLEPRMVLGVISRAKGEGMTIGEYATSAQYPRERAIAAAWLKYEQALKGDGAVDFDDLLLLPVRLLQEHQELRAQYQAQWRYIHIDEYQDTNKIQAQLAELLVGKERNLCAVGDIDQCLTSGTLVTMADGSKRPIEKVKKNDEVLSCYGSGDYRAARVERARGRKTPETLICIRTRTGRTLTSTADHMHFAGYRPGVTPQLYFTYLMYKKEVGFRLGVSQTYTNGQKVSVIGPVQRCNQEHADALWVVAAHKTPQDARVLEYILSLRYGIPTLPFIARKGGGANGYVHDQDVLHKVFASFNTTKTAQELMREYGLSVHHPHHRPQSKNSNRRNIILTLCGDRRGKTPMHRISITGNDKEGRDALESLGLSVRRAKKDSKSWRFETASKNYDALLAIALNIAKIFDDATVIQTARLGGKKTNPKNSNSLPLLSASSLRPGMVLFDETGGFDLIESSEKVEAPGKKVYDLDIEPTHNFIANGIVTHNCIYSWRGAQIANLLSFDKTYPGAKLVVLEENYRSTKNILAAANDIISKNVFRKEKTLFTKNYDGETLALYQAFDETDEAGFVVRTVKEKIAEGAQPKDFAVLYRANFQSRALEEQFLASGVEHQVLGTRFFERKEVKDMLSYVRAAVFETPADIQRALEAVPRGIGKVTQVKMFAGKESELTGAIKEKVAAFRRLLAKIAEESQKLPPSALMKFVIVESGMEKLLKEDKLEGLERLENLQELVSLAARYDNLSPSKSDLQEKGSLTYWASGLEKFLESAALQSEQDEIKEECNAVRLMTVHAAKGLEFPNVFIVGLEEGLFPYERQDDEGSDKEEERRLMYVALTRAKRKLYLSYASYRTVFGSKNSTIPSQFLSDLPQDLLELESPERLGKTIYLD